MTRRHNWLRQDRGLDRKMREMLRTMSILMKMRTWSNQCQIWSWNNQQPYIVLIHYFQMTWVPMLLT